MEVFVLGDLCYRVTSNKIELNEPLLAIFSIYQLNLSETHSSVSLYSGWDLSEFDIIAHIPIKASNDFYTLGDVIANGQSIHGEHISLQAAVKNVSLLNPLYSLRTIIIFLKPVSYIAVHLLVLHMLKLQDMIFMLKAKHCLTS